VSTIANAVASKIQAKFKSVPVDDDSVSNYFRCMIYGPTNSFKTTTAAKFGGPERTLIISTRDPEQVRIPLRGLGFKPIVLAHDSDAFLSCLQFPEKAAEAIGFPEWKDRDDRVLMVDDWTEGASLLVDDNSTNDEGREIKNGMKIYGEVKKDVREVLNALKLKEKRMHLVFTALVADNDWALWPDMAKGARNGINAAFDYVFYMDAEMKKMKTTDGFGVPYQAKDALGKDVTRLRKGFAKYKIPSSMVGQQPPVIAKEEPMDLKAVWEKVVAAKGVK
jgi:hypothetical protein